jgi:molybdopterin-guanine dinucleotide biosynthesis protein A
VDRPIAALRAVFGPVVRLVGACDPLVAARGDGRIGDAFPGAGPMGGVVSALRAGGEAGVFVLAGDMPGVTPAEVRAVLAAAAGAPQAWAVLAEAGRVHPCFGVYRRGAPEILEARLAAGERGLTGALPVERVARVAVPDRAAANINTVEELRAWAAG